MFDKIRLISLLSILIGGANTGALADTIHLTSGQVIEGTVVERTGEEIRVDTGIGVLVTYYLDEVREIVPAAASLPSIPEITTGAPADVPQPDGGSSADAASVSSEAYTGQEISAPPPSAADLDAKSREEHFLLLQYQDNMAQKTQADEPASKPLSSDEYLKKQLSQKQAVLKEDISKTVHLADQKITQGVKELFNKNPQAKETLKPRSLPSYFPALFIGILVAFYVLICYPCMMIAQKLGLAGWMAWIPVVQIFLLFQMAARPWWWVLFLFIPGINLLIPIILWADIAKRFGKSFLLGILMIVPVLNLVIPWYIALSPPAEE